MFTTRAFRRIDYFLLIASLLLLAIGWFSVYSTSYEQKMATGIDYPQKQLVWMIIAMLVFFIMLFVDYQFFLKLSPLIYAVVLVLLVLVLFLGDKRYGASRWINIAGFNFQPSELAKLGIILAVTKYMVFDIDNADSLRYIVITGIIIFFPLILILKQPDLGTALVFIPTVGLMLFVAGVSWKKLASIVLVGLLCLPSAWMFLKEYQKKRIYSFFNPEHDPLGAGYSIIQSKIAVGSGGLFGKGWLSGTQNRLNFLPERHTDFIFSIIGEEWGFVGAIVILILFFVIIASGYNIANKSPDIGGKLLALGIITMFSVQVGVNIGMTLGLMPVTGIPLPFISYGGTSLVITMGSLGLLQNIYMRRFIF